MKITNCKVNHIENPLGYHLAAPVFSYLVEETIGTTNTGSRILVARDPEMTEIVADTGWGEINCCGRKLPMELLPRTRYYWTVQVDTDAAEELSSAVNWFETAKQEEEWTGKWITAAEEERLPVFTRRFTLKTGEDGEKTGQKTESGLHLLRRIGKRKSAENGIVSARLYISGLGLYHCRINGREVTEEKLMPYCSSYENWIQYQTWDVEELLQEENEITISLAPGWYRGPLCTIAELHVLFADGEELVIGTDESWQVKRSTIFFSDLRKGEQRDDNLQETEAEPAILLGDEEHPAPAGRLTARMSPPLLLREEHPATLLHNEKGEWIYDLGRIIAGDFRLALQVPKGQPVSVQLGTQLLDGCFFRGEDGSNPDYVYISKGEPCVLEPQFSYARFRYAKVTGADQLKAEDFTGIARYAAADDGSTLVTGSDRINALARELGEIRKWNFIDNPTDYPARSDDLGWTGDAWAFASTAFYYTDAAAFYRKYLYDLRMEQSAAGGAVPCVVPGFGIRETSAAWGDCAVLLPWTMYLYTGDQSILEEAFESMCRWVDYITALDGENHGWRAVFHLGDWMARDAVGSRPDAVKGSTDQGYIADVFYMRSAEIVSAVANILAGSLFDQELEGGFTRMQEYLGLAEHYRRLTETLRQSILEEYFTPTGRCAVSTQTGYLLALHMGLAGDPQKTLEALITDLKARGDHPVTGFVGTPLLLQELSAAGRDREAYRLLLREGENWTDRLACGAVGEWLWQNVGGIRPILDVPGFAAALIRPVPEYSIRFSKAEYHSPAGCWRVEWQVLDAFHVNVKVEVPFDCSAKLLLPYAKAEESAFDLGPGIFEITYELTESLLPVFTLESSFMEAAENYRVREKLQLLLPDLAAPKWKQVGMTLKEALSDLYPGDSLELILGEARRLLEEE